MIQTVQKKVDGKTYQITHYQTDPAMILLARIEKVFGKSIGLLVDASLKTHGDSLMDGLLSGQVQLSVLFDSLLEKISPEEVPVFAREILSTTKIQEKGSFNDIIFETEFAGAQKHLFKLLKEVLAFQYADFLEGLVAAKSQAAARVVPAQNRVQAMEHPISI